MLKQSENTVLFYIFLLECVFPLFGSTKHAGVYMHSYAWYMLYRQCTYGKRDFIAYTAHFIPIFFTAQNVLLAMYNLLLSYICK